MDQLKPELLIELITKTMPFWQVQSTLYCNLRWLIWVVLPKEGFPGWKNGDASHTVYEIKLNGLEYLLKELKQELGKQNHSR